MKLPTKYGISLLVLLIIGMTGHGQQSVGIGTTTPDNKAALDISSTQKGILVPALNAAQITTLKGKLTPPETGMLVRDFTTGALQFFDGSAIHGFTSLTPLTALAPLAFSANKIRINPGTATGDLISWDGNNWVSKQPASATPFSFVVDNRQPFLAINYCISLFGVFPSQNDAALPFVGEIFLMGCNFPPSGFASCNGALLSIAENQVLFALIGTTYGGNGQTTFALPDLRGRVAVDQGNNSSSNYIMGQSGGVEQNTFSH